jgi:hypothetical protein
VVTPVDGANVYPSGSVIVPSGFTVMSVFCCIPGPWPGALPVGLNACPVAVSLYGPSDVGTGLPLES